MSQLIPLLSFEEGFSSAPYLDTEGYPTVGFGMRIGPKGAILKNYTFTLTKKVSEIWLEAYLEDLKREMNSHSLIAAALRQCNCPRADILYSMGFQLGVSGLAGFKKMLAMTGSANFNGAAHEMMNSRWSTQTPVRACRHAEVIKTGTFECYRGLL